MNDKQLQQSINKNRMPDVPYGLCYASNMVMRDGHPVGYMYRRQPHYDGDSGWVFLGGSETEEYMDNPNNNALYSLSALAEHDPSIIPFLDAPIGSAFARQSKSREFVKVNTPDSVHPNTTPFASN